MNRGSPPRWLHRSELHVVLPLLILVAAINAFAAWGILAGRHSALEAVSKELELQTLAEARSLEALLATLRGDFLFLGDSPPIGRFLTTRGDPDPMVRRWSRLDAEATLLLFLKANPPVERIVLRGGDGEVLLVAGRRHGVPELLPPATAAASPVEGAQLLSGRWRLSPVGQGGAELTAWVDVSGLLAIAAPGLEDRLSVETVAAGGSAAGAVAAGSPLEARQPVVDDSWDPPIRWQLVRREPRSRLESSVESLAGRLSLPIGLNLAVISLTLLLGTLAFRQVRRAAQLEAEAAQQARVRELERRLERSEHLASVGRLAAGIAHEINNPLEGMTNHLALLQDDLGQGDLAAARRQVSRVQQGLRRAAGIVRQVLTFAAPGESGRCQVELAGVVAEAAAFVRSNPAHTGVEIRFQPPAEPLVGHLNPVTMGQLLLNLLLNACEAQPEGGEVEITLAGEGEQAVITVADRGPGFSPEAMAHLFEPFFSSRGSAGLGLAVSHGIARDHGGDIRVRNRGGGGAEVEVELCLAAPEAAAVEVAS